MEQKTFVEQMAYLSVAYDREITKETSALYWHQLGSLPDLQFKQAVQKYVGQGKHFPRVSELREAVRIAMLAVTPKALPSPEVDTVALLSEHARILGVDEAAYVEELLGSSK